MDSRVKSILRDIFTHGYSHIDSDDTEGRKAVSELKRGGLVSSEVVVSDVEGLPWHLVVTPRVSILASRRISEQAQGKYNGR